MTFSNLGLNPIFVDAVEKKGYTEPTPVQSKVIPWILKGKDILASAQTGTGKTAGFHCPYCSAYQNKSIIRQDLYEP